MAEKSITEEKVGLEATRASQGRYTIEYKTDDRTGLNVVKKCTFPTDVFTLSLTLLHPIIQFWLSQFSLNDDKAATQFATQFCPAKLLQQTVPESISCCILIALFILLDYILLTVQLPGGQIESVCTPCRAKLVEMNQNYFQQLADFNKRGILADMVTLVFL
jgi:hypothetical protein